MMVGEKEGNWIADERVEHLWTQNAVLFLALYAYFSDVLFWATLVDPSPLLLLKARSFGQTPCHGSMGGRFLWEDVV